MTKFSLGAFQVKLEDELVFECSIHVDYPEDSYSSTVHKPGEIKAFVEGDWVTHLLTLAPLVAAHKSEQHKLAEKQRREDPGKLADLRKRFGIE